MTTPGALGRRKEVRQKHDIILGVSGIGSLVVDWGRQGAMAALAKVLADNFVFVGGQNGIEGLADKLQVVEIGGSAVPKYFDLDLDREAPRGWRKRTGMVETVNGKANS